MDAIAAERKEPLADYLQTISVLREKDYSWRDIANFLNQHGVKTNHSKVFRFFQKNRGGIMSPIPTKDEYKKALENIKNTLSDNQLKMLQYHYKAPNRTVTFRQLAAEVNFQDHGGVNLHYGKLGKALGEAINFEFPISPERGEPFYSGSIGTGISQPKDIDFQFMMHHSLSDALRELDWF